MGSRLSSPGPQQRRFAAYIEGLANAAGHADRHTPLKNYCKGLLLAGERKSIEPMAARLAPNDVRRMHQSLHHLVADAPWNDEKMLAEVTEGEARLTESDGARSRFRLALGLPGIEVDQGRMAASAPAQPRTMPGQRHAKRDPIGWPVLANATSGTI